MSYPINLIKALYNFNHHKTKLGNYPIVCEIEPTNICNLNCTFCARDHIKKRGLGYMTSETFDNIVQIRNLWNLRHVQLFMHGEPLKHAFLGAFVKQLKQYANSVSITTNGTLMNPVQTWNLLKNGLDHVCFSFEGTNKEVYERLRRGSDYKLVFENIKHFVKVRNEMYPKVSVIIAIVDCPETHADLKSFVRYWKRYVDNVLVLPIHDWGLGVVENGLCDRETMCFWPWYGFGVWWDGTVTPCCMYEDDSLQLGNVNESSLMEIWNGEKYQDFRRKMINEVDIIPICRDCSIQAFSDKFLRTIGNPTRWFPISWSTTRFVKDMTRKVWRRIS